MCELLDAEVPDVKFVILGPGWVRTKIHDAVLQAGKIAPVRLMTRLESDCKPTISHPWKKCSTAAIGRLRYALQRSRQREEFQRDARFVAAAEIHRSADFK